MQVMNLAQLDSFFPDLSAALAYRTFCRPDLSSHRSSDHGNLVERARVHLRTAEHVSVPTQGGTVQTYVLQPDDGKVRANVLLVHGWSAEASFMSVFAHQLTKRGYRVVLFDFPAHGQSPGRRTTMINCAHSVRDVAEALGPIQFVVAHSLGGLATLLAGWGGQPMPRPYPFRAYACVSLPNSFPELVRGFASSISLSGSAQARLEQMLENYGGRKLEDFTSANLIGAIQRPALFVHCEDDDEIDIGNSERAAAGSSTAELKRFSGLGHRKILYAPPVVRAITSFVDEQAQHLGPFEAWQVPKQRRVSLGQSLAERLQDQARLAAKQRLRGFGGQGNLQAAG
ncbi:MAG: alpha/beta fold hydrolase [Pseudomonadota bacterium]